MFRLMVLTLMVTGPGTSGYVRRRAYSGGGRLPRGAEGKAAIAARAGLALPLMAMILAYVGPDWGSSRYWLSSCRERNANSSLGSARSIGPISPDPEGSCHAPE